MDYQYSGKIFQNRDMDFDFCRSFLIVSMIFTHIFEFYYLPDYNRNLTYYVTLGFVFISGFAQGAQSSSSDSFGLDTSLLFKKVFKRSMKLILLYSICNFGIIVMDQSRFDLIKNCNPITIAIFALSGDADDIFSFDILPAISLTAIFSWFIISVTKHMKSNVILISIIPFFLLYAIESFFGPKLFTIKMSMVGLSGILLGKAASQINWLYFTQFLSFWKITIFTGILSALYFSSVYFLFIPLSPILIWRHFFPTIILMLFIYMLSYDIRLKEYQWVLFLNATVGKYMLFTYILHIGVIRFSNLFIERNLGLLECVVLSFFLLAIMLMLCYLTNIFRQKHIVIDRLYNFLFCF